MSDGSYDSNITDLHPAQTIHAETSVRQVLLTRVLVVLYTIISFLPAYNITSSTLSSRCGYHASTCARK